MPGNSRRVVWSKPPARWWLVFLRVLILVLLLLLAGMLYASFNPWVLQRFLIKGGLVVGIPDFKTTPAAPVITAPRGEMPAGPLALTGQAGSNPFSCGFVLQTPDGKRAIVATAHAALPYSGPVAGQMTAADGTVIARLSGQLAYGNPFSGNNLDEDYSLWRIDGPVAEESVLLADPRGLPLPGERVSLFNYAREAGRDGGWAGTVLQADSHGVWVRYDDSFDVNINSGCPVVSQHTGKLIGMVIAGQDRSPVLMGLHPVASLIAKVKAVLH